MTQLRTRLLGLAGIVALAAFVIGVPVLLLAINATPAPSDFTWTALNSPDDGTVALAVIGVVAWLSWAIFAVSIVIDIGARVRGLRAPRLPGLWLPQLAAGRLVGVAALLFVSVPAIAPVAPLSRAAAEASQAPTSVTQPARPATVVAAPAPRPETTLPPQTDPYTVKRGDSLWKIAEEHLGDGTRYVELAEINRGVLNDEPDFLTPGTVLQVPVETPSLDESSYVVEPGDTLSEIAETELGDASAYPEVADASRATVQPDGDRLTDPDLIRPGWRLTLPSDDGTDPEVAPNHGHHDLQPRDEKIEPPVVRPDAPAANDPVPESGVDQSAGDDTQEATKGDAHDELPSWVLPGLAGGGAVLAGSLLLVLRQHRRTQLRYRRPGHVVVPPPRELRPVEKSAQASGSVTAPRIEALDRSLRHLGNPSTPCPRVVIASLDAESVTIELARPEDLPAPWSGEGTTWKVALNDVSAERPGSVSPYPLLVSVGVDAGGALVFVNLEEIHAATLTGPTDQATALGRHIAAELSLSPWSTLVEIDTLGIGDELADIDPSRLHHHASDDTAFLEQFASDLEAENPRMEPDQFRTLITSAMPSDAEAVRKVAKIITSYEGRSGAAVLTIGSDQSIGDVELRLSATGMLVIEPLGLNLTAAGLTADEARACASLVDITRETSTVPMPVGGPDSLADAGGALNQKLTAARPTDGPAGDRSLLPLPAHEYESRAATLADDVERLAPVVTQAAAQQVQERDPQLDEDVARWQASRLMGPKLTLLGPISARTLGDVRKMAHRRPFYVELLAYLVIHPSGVTADQVSDAFGIQPERARKDLGIVRGWLGTDAHTGKPHLPNARQTHANGVKAKYVVNGIATDLDLFRRLRTRGQSRGSAGIDDFRTALALVSGEPFTDLRPAGWGWLLDGERLDHIMACAIVDTAHIVTTHALAADDLNLARFAAETGVEAAPHDETAQLDLVAVEKAAGDDERADNRLASNVLDRADDDLGPIEVPQRSVGIVRQRGWDQHRSRSAG